MSKSNLQVLEEGLTYMRAGAKKTKALKGDYFAKEVGGKLECCALGAMAVGMAGTTQRDKLYTTVNGDGSFTKHTKFSRLEARVNALYEDEYDIGIAEDNDCGVGRGGVIRRLAKLVDKERARRAAKAGK